MNTRRAGAAVGIDQAGCPQFRTIAHGAGLYVSSVMVYRNLRTTAPGGYFTFVIGK